MLAGATFVFLGLFTAYAKGQLMAASAKCLMGYEWVCFNRIAYQSTYLTAPITDF